MFNRKKIILLLTITLITVLLLISGCSTILFGPSGSIEVTSNPSGAKIFLDSKDTGKITTYTLKNVSVGSHIVEVTLSDMRYTKIAKVEAYQTTNINIEFYSQSTLSKINVLPPITTIALSLGNTVTISSVTAYYSDYSSANIPLTNCTYSSNCTCATINSSGTITGISAGAAIITIAYTEGGITKTDTVSVLVRNTPTDTPPITPPVEDDITYRALLVGVGDYENDDGVTLTDLEGPPYDVDRIKQVLNQQCKFGSDEIGFSLVEPLKDLSATKEAIINGIASTFSGADENDISYFYFSGHGSYTGVFENSYILPTDVDGSIDSAISVDELEIALSAIPGTKVVIFDSCFSGGFIGKGKGEIIISREKLTSFNDEIINIFSQAQSKGLLTTNKYKVLTSCHYNQPCVEYSTHPVDGNPYGLFTAAFCKGCGYDDGTYYADSDNNTKVSLQEAYSYIESTLILSEQDVQVYPTISTFTIVEY
jgi:hypothetical protein